MFRPDVRQAMKIATFNINNVNRRLPNLLRWLRSAKPDVVALQELKSTDADFPISAIEKAGYGATEGRDRFTNSIRGDIPDECSDRLPARCAPSNSCRPTRFSFRRGAQGCPEGPFLSAAPRN